MTEPLAPYAIPIDDYGEREYIENKHLFRAHFERDRARIVHSEAFRRLGYKTQVFFNHLVDTNTPVGMRYFRTRLTHSIEVAQIARSVARHLRVCEDLAEAIALAHDIGHPPFGHSGEKKLNALMHAHGGFNHNKQTLRIVTHLEVQYPQFLGLNLTRGTRLGLQKHNKLPDNHSHSIEALLVDICDEIAYNNHDIDDGIMSDMIHIDDMKNIEIWVTQWSQVTQAYPSMNPKARLKYAVRCLVNDMVTHLISNVKKNLDLYHIKNFNDVLYFHQNHPGKMLVCFDNNYYQQILEIKQFLNKRLYHHESIQQSIITNDDLLEKVFYFYLENVLEIPEQYKSKEINHHQMVCDYIGSMTDKDIIDHYERIS